MASILSPFYRWTERSPDQLLYAFLDVEGRIAESYSYAQFLQRTTDIASHIRRTHPMAAAERVLLAYPPGLEMICAFAACVRLGLIPVPVYPSTSQGLQAALDKTDFIARDCQAAAVLTARSYYWSMKLNEARNSVATLSLRRSKASRLKWIVSTDADKGARADFSDVHSDVLFLQYTSGSTSEPKGVMVTHENILENCEAVVDHRPVGVSWLPQYHDMGLIGYYLFFALKGGTTYGLSPLDFIQRPALWLETISNYRGTASSAPNFAYEYCLRPEKVPAATLEHLDLSSLRFLMTAAEPVRANVFRDFIRKFEPYGLNPKSFFAAYGLAEFTLAVSNYGRTIQAFDRAALRQHLVQPADPDAVGADTTTLVSCGRRLCCNFRAATSGWTTYGKHRTGSPIMPSDNPFKWRQFEPALILQCVRWYLRYALSYRDLEDMMRERGLCVDHTTIYRWVQRYAPEIDKRCRPFLRRTNDSYRIDETYVRVAGAWTYLYRGVDSNGDTLDFLLRATRDRKAAIAFFRKTLGAAHTTPARVVTVDKNPAYPVAFEAVRHEGLVRPRSNLRQCKYLNNIIEQDHRFIKRRTRPMLGFKRFTTAWRTLRGIEIMHALRKGQARWMAKGDVVGQTQLIHKVFGLAA